MIIYAIFLIFFGAALLSTAALYTRQSLLVAYILLGMLLGPWGLKLISDVTFIRQIGSIGIVFLLFLVGLNLHPQSLWHLFRKMTIVTLLSALLFAAIGYLVAILFGYSQLDSILISAAMMFSSTIIGLKLLPTTILHRRHTGELMISVLLLQDFIAILVLLAIEADSARAFSWTHISLLAVSLPLMGLIAFLIERFILVKLISRFSRIQEYIFLLAIGWCLGMAQLAGLLGLSQGIGAFIAGVALAASPISPYIAESLKPLRNFVLVMFFFAIGANFNFHYLPIVIMPAAVLALTALLLKPLIFRVLFRYIRESRKVSWEVGVRLGQMSEFSLLVAYVAISSGIIGTSASFLIQAATIMTFIVSSYWIVLRYPTPMAISEKLQQD